MNSDTTYSCYRCNEGCVLDNAFSVKIVDKNIHGKDYIIVAPSAKTNTWICMECYAADMMEEYLNN
jgi:hypothetical protein